MGALVSVIIPCYNAERWIAATLDSVLAQTYQPIEIIAVDDGSTDATAAIVEGYAPRGVQHLRLQRRQAAAARNSGFAGSRGEYIQFLDADDLLAADKIALQVAALRRAPGALAMAEWARFRMNPAEARFVRDATWADLQPVDWLTQAFLLGGAMMFPAMWLAPRHIVERAGPWAEFLSLNDDAEYFARLILSATQVVFTNGARCFYRSSVPGSLSSRKSRAAWESQYLSFALCEAYLRQREDSERTQKACAIVWQKIAHACYPYATDIAEHALGRARSLDEVRIAPEGGRAFRAVAALAGWRVARRLQRLSGRP